MSVTRPDTMGRVTPPSPSIEQAKEEVSPPKRITICGKCLKPGHYSKTCGRPPPPPHEKGQRHCRNCGAPGHYAKSCPEPLRAVAAPEPVLPRRPRHVVVSDWRPKRSEAPPRSMVGVGSGRAPRRRVCKKCGTPGHVQAGCPEGREADYKFEPAVAGAGARYRVVEDFEDEHGQRWRQDDVWSAARQLGRDGAHGRWRLEARGQRARVGHPTLHPFQLVPPAGGPSVDRDLRLGVGAYSDVFAA